MADPLHIKYRPKKLDDVVGQSTVVLSLRNLLSSRRVPHAFLFFGPSGCGKTTLARIVADVLECEVVEIDAATHTGIDSMRGVMDMTRYQGFGEKANRMVIIDEAHALSKAAWQSMLKVIEEPPDHVFFALCTTEAVKVPSTIQTRCATHTLDRVRRNDMFSLLESVCRTEKFETPDSVLSCVVDWADGSPRKALVGLAMVHDMDVVKDVADVLSQHLDNKEVIDLCRALVDRSLKWEKAVAILKEMKDENPESVRIVIINYLTSVLLNAKGSDVPRLLDLLNAFKTPCNSSEKFAPIVLAIGNVLFPS